MKKLFLLLLLPIILSCQESPEEIHQQNVVIRNGIYYKINTDVPFTGTTFSLYGNQQKQTVRRYTKGIRDGAWVNYHENGQLQLKVTYKDSLLNGVTERYSNNGQLIKKMNYLNGKFNGSFESWTKKGNILLVTSYKDGVLDGSYSENYEDGTPKIKTTYVNGNIQGIYTEYWRNGNNKFSYTKNKTGLYIDDYRKYNEDGTTNIHTFYTTNGNKRNKGTWQRYWSSDWKRVTSPAMYKSKVSFNDNGKPSSNTIFYYQNGQKFSEGYYSSIEPDIKNGKFIWYYENGCVKKTTEFKDNKRDGIAESYYINNNFTGMSKQLERAHFKNDKLHGKYVLYNGSSQRDLPQIVSYKVAQMGGIGSRKWWKVEGNCVNGKFNGEFKMWWRYATNRRSEPFNMPAYAKQQWSNGKLIFNGFNSRNGAFDYYDTNGKLLSFDERKKMLNTVEKQKKK